MYRFDGDMLRNVHLFDRANPTVRRGDDAPLAETYCSLVGAARGPFVTTDAEADPRLLEHPARLCVRSYCGALLRHADATPFGTVCSFDVVSQPAPDELVTLLQLVAPISAPRLTRRPDSGDDAAGFGRSHVLRPAMAGGVQGALDLDRAPRGD